MKICVIGNSHMASLKLGWDRTLSDYPEVVLAFFGASANRLAGLERQDGRLVAADPDLAKRVSITSGGATAIKPAEHDAVLLAGLNFGLGPGFKHGYSRAVQEAALRDRFGATLCGHICELVRAAAPTTPVHIMPKPLPRRGGSRSHRVVQSYSERLATARGALHTLLAGGDVAGQPPSTIIDETWTKAVYGQGAIGLDQGRGYLSKGAEDTSHMNDSYGEAFLRYWLATLIGTG